MALREPRIDFQRLGGRVVVDENDVQVRGVAEFLAAELAVGDDREARRPVDVAVAKLRPDQHQRLVEDDIGQGRQVVGDPLQREHVAEILRKQPERGRLVLLAQYVHLRFDIARVPRNFVAHRVDERGPVGRGVEYLVIKQLIEQQRVLGHVVRRPA